MIALARSALLAAATLGPLPACAGAAPVPGATRDAASAERAGPDWVPCANDPRRGSLVQCSEEYRLCREAGGAVQACLAGPYGTLTPATAPSDDEVAACAASGLPAARCDAIFAGPAED